MGKKEKQDRGQIYDYLRSRGAYHNDDKYESLENLRAKEGSQRELQAAEEKEEKEKQRLLEDLSFYRPLTDEDYTKTSDELRQERDAENQRMTKALNEGKLLEIAQFAGDAFGGPIFTEENKAKLDANINTTWEKERERQENEAANSTVKANLYEGNFATQTGQNLVKASEGYQTAIMLMQNTPFYKKIAPYVQKLDSKLVSRLFNGVKPVYLDNKGGFASNRDKENYTWNIDYLRSLSYNTDSSFGRDFVDNYLDEIISMDAEVYSILKDGSKAIRLHPEIFYRMQTLALTFDFYSKTNVFKSYLKTQNGGKEPRGESEWSAKAKAAAALTEVMARLSHLFTGMQGKNGINGEAGGEVRYSGSNAGDIQKRSIFTDEKDNLEYANEAYTKYKAAREEFNKEDGKNILRATNSDYRRQ